MESASQSGKRNELVKMTNLQWRLMTETETGRRLERQQLAKVHALAENIGKTMRRACAGILRVMLTMMM